MADEADNGNNIAETLLRFDLQRMKPEAPKAGGTCLWCGEAIPLDRRWCDSECRDDYEAYAE